MEGVYALEEAVQQAASDAGRMTDGAFFRVKRQWVLQDASGRFVLLPEECEVLELGEVIV